MYKAILFFALNLFCTTFFAQNKKYFQQETNYKINVSLDDEKFRLKGNMTLEYVNNSPDALPFIWFHLWANAHSDNNNTTLAREKLQHGDTRLYFAKEENLGSYRNIQFADAGGNILPAYSEPQKPDVVKVTLAKPLLSGEKMQLNVAFEIQLPRYENVKSDNAQTFQMTSWYPQPAVYDASGWNLYPMSYLNGRYSEFGNFEVALTLPSNYVVAASGDLMTESEQIFLKNKSLTINDLRNKKNDLPPSEKTLKTINYQANQIHDFVWYADKRYLLQSQKVRLASGKIVTANAFYLPSQQKSWKNSIPIISKAIKFYSEAVAEYSQSQISVVGNNGDERGVSGFEMLTSVENETDTVKLEKLIAHGIGHNWFAGVIANNQHEHGWIDEGLNTYFDNRYSELHQPAANRIMSKSITKDTLLKDNELAYIEQATSDYDQAPSTRTGDYIDQEHHQVGAFSKPAIGFRLMEKQAGRAAFDAAIKDFYANWKFKHPQPQDLQQLLEKRLNKKLDWFFNDMIAGSEKQDYSLSFQQKLPSGESELEVVNRGILGTPFSISAEKDGKIVAEKWYDGFGKSEQKIIFPKGDYDRFILDAAYVSPELFRQNNIARTKGLFKNSITYGIKFFSFKEEVNKINFNVNPIVSWNQYDGVSVGALINNGFLLNKNAQFFAAPMYSFKSKTWNGTFGTNMTLPLRNKLIEQLNFNFRSTDFSYNYDKDYKFYDRYTRAQFGVSSTLRASLNSSFRHQFGYRFVGVEQNYGVGDSFADLKYHIESSRHNVHEFQYTFTNRFVLNPAVVKLTAQFSKQFSRLTADWKQDFVLGEAMRGTPKIFEKASRLVVSFHAFAGILPPLGVGFTRPNVNFTLSGKGNGSTPLYQTDYLFEESLLGRSDRTGLWSQQIFQRDANLKTLSNIGSSAEWMTGAGAAVTLPLPFPVRAYFDAAVSPALNGSPQLLYSGGIAFTPIRDVLEIYFPLLNSKEIDTNLNLQSREKYSQRITFLLNLNALNPFGTQKMVFDF